MAIDSVSSAVSPTVQQPPPQNREAQRAETERPQPQRRPEPPQETAQTQTEPQQRPPVINTQGQVTGTSINTTA